MTELAAPATTSVLARWRHILRTSNPPKGELDPVSRWLVLTRAAVLPMTIAAGIVAGLLGRRPRRARRWLFALAMVGIVLAHMANNLMNDLFDLEVGTDSEDYPRNLYSPHPVLSGVISRAGLGRRVARRQRDLPRDHDRAHRRARAGRSWRSRSAASCSPPRTPRRRCA